MPTLLCEIRDSQSFSHEKRNDSFHVTGPKYDIVGGGLSFATDGLPGSMTLSLMTVESIPAAKDLLRSSASVQTRDCLTLRSTGCNVARHGLDVVKVMFFDC